MTIKFKRREKNNLKPPTNERGTVSVVVTVQDTCSISVPLTQLTTLPDHIVLGYDHSAGEAKSWKARSNLGVPEKLLAPTLVTQQGQRCPGQQPTCKGYS